MRHWNYRIIRKNSQEAEDNQTLSIHEVYYDSDGNPNAMTVESVAPMLTAYPAEGESEKDIITWLEMVLADVTRHAVLDYEDIKTDEDIDD